MTDVVVDAGGDPERPRTRRQLLKLAGVAAVGGAGLVLKNTSPAFGADGGNLIIGASNTGTNQTSLSNNSSGGAAFAAINNNSGGYGVVASGGFIDLKLNGTGIMTQFAAAGTTSGHAPTQNPSAQDLARGAGHVLWASASANSWKRINAVRVDNASGDGTPFTPFRLIDTRAGASHVGPLNGPFNSGTTQTVTVAGVGGVPADAIAIFGNLTAVFPTYSGWLTIFPSSLATPPVVSNVNFGAGGVFPNSVFVGLSDGSCKVYLGAGGGQSGNTNFILDIFGYVQ
jgi:hypothetical protein